MKTIKRIAVLAALTFLTVAASAQIKIGANAGLMMPMGDFADVASTGFGGSIVGKYMINDQMAAGLNIGYYKMGEELDGYENALTPITANFTYYFGSEGFKAYAGADLGMYMYSYKYSMTDTYSYGGYSTSYSVDLDGSESYFGLAPVIGCEYDFSDALALDVNVKYNYIMAEEDAITALGINVGIVYSLGK